MSETARKVDKWLPALNELVLLMCLKTVPPDQVMKVRVLLEADEILGAPWAAIAQGVRP